MSLIDRIQAFIPRPKASGAPRAAVAAPGAGATPAIAADERQAATARPEDVARTLGEPARRAYAALSAADREAYAGAWQVAGPEGRRRMATLLERGRMGDRDADGRSLASNLGRLSGLAAPKGAPYTAPEVLTHLVDPSEINQSSRNTCGATTVQYMLLREQPAEYTRLVAGLLGPGTVELRSGDTMRRVADSVEDDGTERDDVERVIQSAFQDHGFELRGRYSNRTDDFQIGPRGGDGWLDKAKRLIAAPENWVIRQIGAQGIAEGKVKDLYEDVTGHQADLVGDLPGGVLLAPLSQRRDVFDRVASAVRAGKEVPVDIVLKDLQDEPGEAREKLVDQSSMSYAELMNSHQILITRIEGDRVHYRNPWGYDTSMSIAEFKSRLTDAFIPR